MPTRKFRQLNNLQQRVVTGFFGVIFMVGMLYYSEWGYFFIFGGLTILCQLEFFQLLFKDGNSPLRHYGTAVGALLFGLSFFIERGDLHPDWYLLLFPLLTLVYFIKLYKKTETKPFTNIGFTFLGIAYAGLPFALLNMAVFAQGQYQFQIVMGILILLWASDSGAYFAGSRYGRTALFARVSPKKSWEGSIGGAAAATLTAFVLSIYFTELLPYHWFAISTVVVVAGTYGDLVESLFKRSILIKDSGSVLPGHGGFLDRFDGLLLSAPFIAPLLKFILD